MSTQNDIDVVIRPVRDTDLEALGRVHAKCWHQTYDQLIPEATLANLSPRRIAELWSHWLQQGEEFHLFAAVVDGEIVGFVGSGPARDTDAPRERELYFIYLLESFQGTGIGQKMFDAVCSSNEGYLWVAKENPRAHRFYERNGFVRDGAEQIHPFLGEEIEEIRFVR